LVVGCWLLVVRCWLLVLVVVLVVVVLGQGETALFGGEDTTRNVDGDTQS
jgi:hypothetical protein